MGEVRDIVLIGGGHAHVHVLKAFAMRPQPGARMTLVSRELSAIYSGMLPGVVAGLYRPEQAEIDLLRLTAAANARLVHAEAVGIDREHKRVVLAGRAPIAYDVLSIDVGVTPSLAPIKGAAEHGIAVKPVDSFLSRFEALRLRCGGKGCRRIAVVGGGAAGVELVLCVERRLRADAQADGGDAGGFEFTLVTRSEILKNHNPRVRSAFRRILGERAIALEEHRSVIAITADRVELADGEAIASDATLVATGACAPRWFADTGLKLDAEGFLLAGPTLQVPDDPDVFAAGDCASLIETPRPKAGVFAVRAGSPLARNLRRRVRGEAARPWRPQRRHLALISTGERYAVASRGPFKAEGVWVWKLKDWIDRRWIGNYQ